MKDLNKQSVNRESEMIPILETNTSKLPAPKDSEMGSKTFPSTLAVSNNKEEGKSEVLVAERGPENMVEAELVSPLMTLLITVEINKEVPTLQNKEVPTQTEAINPPERIELPVSTKEKLKAVKLALKDWHHQTFSNVDDEVQCARNILSSIQETISTHGLTEQRFQEEIDVNLMVQRAVHNQNLFLQDKARVKWLTEGDRCTKFFHTYAKARASQARIFTLQINGNVISDPTLLSNHIVEYYHKLYKTYDGDVNDDAGMASSSLLSLIPNVISMEENNFLTFIPSDLEITDAVFSINPASAPGPDGFPGGNIAIKLDIVKAFDMLKWNFLLEVLHLFGVHQTFIQWINTILKSAKPSILVNGTPKGFFSCDRGVRQGDPLSPLLFCIAEDVLSRGISHLVSIGSIKLISSPRGCTVASHVLYADDVMIFCRSDSRSLRNLKVFLEEYGSASGQLISTEKSKFFLGKSASHRPSVVKDILNFQEPFLPFIYLGVPIFCGKPRQIYLQVLADKVRARLEGWRGKLLSLVGRTQLVQTVIQSTILHSFSIYKWPVSLIKMVNTWCRNFIWSGNCHTRKLITVPWRKVCLPYGEGGLGLRDFKTLNDSALFCLSWKMLSSSTSWNLFYKNRFHFDINCHFSRYSLSSVWMRIKEVLPRLKEGSKWIIGNGKSDSFWLDN
ncbi:Ribonuclease H [Melia azedarach]|uniref:Ribonuclease H n=1 Tax=Melia azedarach TaxID=155640 RepID=A0ACC1Y1U3_MELAZ|nr:Ribonuclease H [Melia azedarach]